MFQSAPGLLRRKSATPYDVFEVEEYQAKYYALMRFMVARDVGMIWTANPSSILKMFEKGAEFAEEIIRDVRDGTLSLARFVDSLTRAPSRIIRLDAEGVSDGAPLYELSFVKLRGVPLSNCRMKAS